MLRVIVVFWHPGRRRMILLYNFTGNNSSTYMKQNVRKNETVLPQEIVDVIEDCGFFESIPLWAVKMADRVVREMVGL